MGDKKRKETSAPAGLPRKKKSKSQETVQTSKAETDATLPDLTPVSANPAGPMPKKSRKRAADFDVAEPAEASELLVDPHLHGRPEDLAPAAAAEGDEHPSKKSKKSKSKKKGKKDKHGDLLSADGVNGVIEHTGAEDLEVAGANEPMSASMQAEADNTVQHELENEFASFSSDQGDSQETQQPDDDDDAGAFLAGFDSDSDDNQPDVGLDLSAIPALPNAKKVRKKLAKLEAKASSQDPGTVYVGRIPHGFYEQQMREYFSQFGDITRLRLSRNKRTGASKHFAFIEFASNDVAKIVAETMDNYLLFGHILKCKYAEPGSLHPELWKGANKKFRKIPHEKLEREQLARPKTVEQWTKKIGREARKRADKARQMAAIGLTMPASSLIGPTESLDKIEDAPHDKTQQPNASMGLLENGAAADEKGATVALPKGRKKQKADKTAEDKQDADQGQALPADQGAPDDEGKAEPQRKLSKKEKKALKKAAAETGADDRLAQATADDPAMAAAEPLDASEKSENAEGELQADFISLGDYNDEEAGERRPGAKVGKGPGNKKLKGEKKNKKERKNLVKARGPKSTLVSTKPPTDPNAT